MINEGKFGVQEAVCLTTVAISIKVFYTSPGFLTRFVGPAGWYMTLVSCSASILAFTFIFLLMKRFPGKNIIEVFELSLGRFTGFIFSFVFIAAILNNTAIMLREFIEVLKIYIFPNTPPSIIAGSFIAVVLVSAFLGLESIARVAKLSAYIMLVFFTLVLIFAAKNYKVTNLFPILGYGFGNTILHGLRRSSTYDEVIILTIFAGSLQGIKHLKKAGYMSLIFSGIILSVGVLCFNMAFPYEVTQELTAPIYVLTRSIKYGSFFQRLDPLFIFIWVFASLITVSVLFYCSASSYCKIFRLQDTRPVIIPMSFLLFGLTMLPKDFSSVVEGGVETSREYGWAVFYLLPFIALVTAALKKKKGGNKAVEN